MSESSPNIFRSPSAHPDTGPSDRADRWLIAADTGGTFTDAIAHGPDGSVSRVKVLSSSTLRLPVHAAAEGVTRLVLTRPLDGHPDAVLGLAIRSRASVPVRVIRATRDWLALDRPLPARPDGSDWCEVELRSPDEAPIFAARLLTGAAHGSGLPPSDLRVATTRATNALLEQTGEPVCLVVDRGFSDLLRIDDQSRPDLFDPTVGRPAPIARCALEVSIRTGADGRVLAPLDADALRTSAAGVVRSGVRTAAVVLLHADRFPDAEHRVARVLREAGFETVRCSSEVAPQIHLLSRAQTTVADATLVSLVRGYVDRVLAPAPRSDLKIMTSAGSLMGPEAFAPKDALLSGPAGGVVGALAAARRLGRERVITFDMGGTSTDVARCDGAVPYTFSHTVGRARILAPAVDINTVAAGGGSVCGSSREGRTVGPASAGAAPGPASYGRGGPLTVTDVNLLLGRLRPSAFGLPLHPEDASCALDGAVEDVAMHTGSRPGRDELLGGFLRIANQRMSDAIHAISTREGVRPGAYAMVAFGGAGPQHACAVSEQLGIREVIVPDDAGLLSADGLRHAPLERFAVRQILAPLPDGPAMASLLSSLEQPALVAFDETLPSGSEPARITRRIASVRPAGQETALDVEFDRAEEVGAAFEAAYVRLFGHAPPARSIELVSLRVVASSPTRVPAEPERSESVPARASVVTQRARFGGAWMEVPVHERGDLGAGETVVGPAIIVDPHATTIVEPGWVARRAAGAMVLEHRAAGDSEVGQDDDGPLATDLFANGLTSIATRMGETLRRTAVSTNVRDRLDFSCAVLDASARLITNAPHVPVHLGALGVCVRSALADERVAPVEAGDVIVTNHPAVGGSHLPDVTVLAPVHASDGTLVAWVASRAHHAELGGIAPGSIPTDASSLLEEGVVLPPTRVVRAGVPSFGVLRAMLSAPPYPSRAAEDNIADLTAAIASVHTATIALTSLADRLGPARFIAQTETLRARAASAVRDHLRARPNGTVSAEEVLDDGTTIRVALTTADDRMRIDFGGTDRTHPGNLNATPAIVRSAVVYVIRCLINEPIPLNEGLLDPVEIVLPHCFLNPVFAPDPADCPAVVGGNVETSQRVVSVLIRALGMQAGSQATMNNIVFGNERVSFYETVCGGSGATLASDGHDAVHTHMTNTRITDPELLEHRYPVRLERFEVRIGSGGRGRTRGGDGVTREITFLEAMRLSVLTQQRSRGPRGMAGGEDGQAGAQWLVRDGATIPLPWAASLDVRPGDRLVMQTPGGAGWGAPEA